MRPTWITALLVLAALPTSAQTGPSPNSPDVKQQGRIVGTVVNDAGEPIREAELCTRITTPNGSTGSCGGTNTDDKGAFAISQLPLSKIEVYARAGLQGYLQEDAAIEKQTVTLTRQAPMARVTLTVGPKPGVLIINVTNKATGKALNSFFVRLIAESGGYCSGSGNFRRLYNSGEAVLVPVGSATEAIVEVSAQGYKSWFYSDPSDPSRPVLRLESGEERSLEVQLEPK